MGGDPAGCSYIESRYDRGGGKNLKNFRPDEGRAEGDGAGNRSGGEKADRG